MGRRLRIVFIALLIGLIIVPAVAFGAVKPKKVTVATDLGVTKIVSVNIGDSVRLTATPYPIDAVTNGFVWKTSNKTIAKVSPAGIVSTFRAGKATISATSRRAGRIGSITVLVVDPKVPTRIALNYAGSIKLGKGSKLPLDYSLSPMTAVSAVKWYTSNKSIASVSTGGTITAKRKGKAKITAKTYLGKRTTTLNVIVPPFDVSIEHGDGNYVGQFISWSVTPRDNVGQVEYTYRIFKNDVEFLRTTSPSPSCGTIIDEPGNYYLEVTATDESGTQVVKSSPVVEVVYINPAVEIRNVKVEYRQDYTYIYATIFASSGKRPYQITAKFFDGDGCWATKRLTNSTTVVFKVLPSVHRTFRIRADITDASGNVDFDEYNVEI